MAKIRLLHVLVQPVLIEEVEEFETKPYRPTQPLALSVGEAKAWLKDMIGQLEKINEEHEADLAKAAAEAEAKVEDGDEEALPCDV